MDARNRWAVLNAVQKANDSDPFAVARMHTHLKRGIVTDDDLIKEGMSAGYALGNRRQDAARTAKHGEFVSMRKV